MDEPETEEGLVASLHGLVGLPLTNAWQNDFGCDVLKFGRRTVEHHGRGGSPQIERYTLDLHCTWGIVRAGRVAVGRLDRGFGDPDLLPNAEGYLARRSARLLDETLATVQRDEPRVVGVRVSRGRDLDIALDDASVVHARPLRSIGDHRHEFDSAYWRFHDELDHESWYVRDTITVARASLPGPKRPEHGPSEPFELVRGDIEPIPEAVLEALNALVGLPMHESERPDDPDLGWIEDFTFGPLVEMPTRGGGTRAVGRYRLRLGCDWGIVRSGRVLVGLEDYFFDHESVAGDASPDTRRDRLLRDAYPAEVAGRLRRVVAVELRARLGLKGAIDLDVTLDDGSVLEVRPLHSLAEPYDYWRLVDVQSRTSVVARHEVSIE